MKLYDYYRSTASYRVRIALNLKGLSFETIAVHLVKQGGEQHSEFYKAINPQELVPTLDDEGDLLTQSLAILEYLEEKYPTPSLLPQNSIQRATARSLALLIVCDMHPLNNLRVLQQLRQQFDATDTQIQKWYHHWLQLGFDALENRLKQINREKPVCIGNHVSMADVCLIPQVYNANRFEFSLQNYPLIQKINDYCLNMNAFKDAAPESVGE